MSTLIISYKQHDQPSVATSLFTQLSAQLPHSKVVGVSTLLNSLIANEVNSARALLIVMGHNWAQGDWLNNPTDDDTLAIQTALNNKNVSVVPILVDGVAVPTDLPEPFSALRYLPNFQISSFDVIAGSQKIVMALQASQGQKQVPSSPFGASNPASFSNPYQTAYQQPSPASFQTPQPPSSVVLAQPQTVYVAHQSSGSPALGCLAAIIEFAAGWFGFLGIGHMIGGEFGTGCMTMIGFWVYLMIAVFVVAVTGGLGIFVCGPLTILIILASAFSAYSSATK